MVWISYRGSEKWEGQSRAKLRIQEKGRYGIKLWGLQNFRQKSRDWKLKLRMRKQVKGEENEKKTP